MPCSGARIGVLAPFRSAPSPGSWPPAIEGSDTEGSPGTGWDSPTALRRSTSGWTTETGGCWRHDPARGDHPVVSKRGSNTVRQQPDRSADDERPGLSPFLQQAPSSRFPRRVGIGAAFLPCQVVVEEATLD